MQTSLRALPTQKNNWKFTETKKIWLKPFTSSWETSKGKCWSLHSFQRATPHSSISLSTKGNAKETFSCFQYDMRSWGFVHHAQFWTFCIVPFLRVNGGERVSRITAALHTLSSEQFLAFRTFIFCCTSCCKRLFITIFRSSLDPYSRLREEISWQTEGPFWWSISKKAVQMFRTNKRSR